MIALCSILAAILLHEAAHVFAAYVLGCRVRALRVTWYPCLLIDNPHHRGKNAVIALAAPALNLALFVIFGCEMWGIWAAGQLVVGVLALLPYPKSDLWRACTYALKGV